jgi:hypothetical protein
MSETPKDRLRKLERRGARYLLSDGPFFCLRELVQLGMFTEGGASRIIDYSTPGKCDRLQFKVIWRGPVSDIVITVSAWTKWIMLQNPEMMIDEAERMVERAVIRTYNRRKSFAPYPSSVLLDYLRKRHSETQPEPEQCELAE